MKFSCDIGILPNRIPYTEIFNILKASSIDTFALNFHCLNNLSQVLNDDYKENALKLCADMKRVGIECNQTYAPFTFFAFDERRDCYSEGYRNVVRAMEFSHILGAKQIVIFPVQTPDEQAQKEYNIKYFRSLIKHSERIGIKIVVPTDYPKYLKNSVMKLPWKTTAEYTEFLSDIASPNIGGCIVLGNTSEQDISDMGKLISATHLLDYASYRDVHTGSFFESVDWKKIFEQLKKTGYDGELTIESPSFLRDYPDALLWAAFALISDIGNYFVNLV